jgi:L-lactate dehydrogenase complex protein LldG
MTGDSPAAGPTPAGSSREVVLGRVRAALADVPSDERPEDHPVPRDYRAAHVPDDPAALTELLAVNLADYRALVHRCDEAGLPGVIAGLLSEHGSRSVIAPVGLPPRWLAEAQGVERPADSAELTAARLDAVDSVLTGCALAIAETGTIVLDGGDGQGRRMLTLVPDHHICVVRVPDQVVASLPQAMPRLDPRRPLTWISGPSATSDIELDRVEGVHGPRTLEVVLVSAG